jgi:hypothetical protein
MFCSVNPRFLAGNSVEKFLLEKDTRGVWAQLRFFAYYNLVGTRRWAPITGDGYHQSMLSEISFPPFGYVLTVDGTAAPDRRLFEITHFQRYGYDDVDDIEMHLPLLETVGELPGVYGQ